MTSSLKTDPRPAEYPYSGTVYKVWHRRCGRWYAHIREPDGGYKLRSWAKYIYETVNKCVIKKGIHVDHIDEDRTNDAIENLQLLGSRVNASKSNTLRRTQAFVELDCPMCGIGFTVPRRQTHLAKKTVATFCSRKCGCKQGRGGVTLHNTYIREFKSAVDSRFYSPEVVGPTPTTRTSEVYSPLVTPVLKFEPNIEYFQIPEKPAAKRCCDCDKLIFKLATRCNRCARIHRLATGTGGKAKYPPLPELKELISRSSVSSVARTLGVSFTALKRWIARRSVDLGTLSTKESNHHSLNRLESKE